MSTKRTLNIGLIGCGFMGRAHSNAFAKVNQFFELEAQPVLKAVCARNPAAAEAFTANWGYESFETDWRDLIRRPDVDLIDIASPNDTHAEIAIAAAEAGKTVMCEKPLGRNAAEAQRMVAAVEAGGHPNMVWYNYRRVPAVTLAKQLIDEGFSCSGSAGRFVLPRGLRFCGDSVAERSPRRVAQSKRPSARHSKLQTMVVEQSVRPR
jgi:predicted dehydrogenase